jgi:hypothetical protein
MSDELQGPRQPQVLDTLAEKFQLAAFSFSGAPR